MPKRQAQPRLFSLYVCVYVRERDTHTHTRDLCGKDTTFHPTYHLYYSTSYFLPRGRRNSVRVPTANVIDDRLVRILTSIREQRGGNVEETFRKYAKLFPHDRRCQERGEKTVRGSICPLMFARRGANPLVLSLQLVLSFRVVCHRARMQMTRPAGWALASGSRIAQEKLNR